MKSCVAAVCAASMLICGELHAQRRRSVRHPSSPVPVAAYTIDSSSNAGGLKALNGVQGGPNAPNTIDPDLTPWFQQARIPIVRLPQDLGFEDDYDPAEHPRDHHLTLGDIFPNRDAGANDAASYDFADIDSFVQKILDSGAEPLWEAMYDIGRDANFWADNGNQAGRGIRDPQKWADVIVHVLRHFNDGWAGGHTWNIRYVEFPNEPCGLGGYDCSRSDNPNYDTSSLNNRPGRRQMHDAYKALVSAVASYNATYGHDVKVVALAHVAGDAIRHGQEFLQYAATNNLPLNIFSYHEYAWPEQAAANAKAVRHLLDTVADGRFRDVPVWNSEWNWPLFNPPPAGLNFTTAAEFSAWVASHNVQVKTLVQGSWDEATVYRVQRSQVRTNRKQPGEHPYFYLDVVPGAPPPGTPKPAYHTFLVFDEASRLTPQRLSATAVTDGPTLLAAKSADGSRLSLITAHFCQTYAPQCVSPYAYAMKITGVAPSTRYRAEELVIDKSTMAFTPRTTSFVESDAAGTLSISTSIDVWAVQYWRLAK